MSHMSDAVIFRLNCEHCTGEGRLCLICEATERECHCPTMPSIGGCPYCSLEAFANTHPVHAKCPYCGLHLDGDVCPSCGARSEEAALLGR